MSHDQRNDSFPPSLRARSASLRSRTRYCSSLVSPRSSLPASSGSESMSSADLGPCRLDARREVADLAAVEGEIVDEEDVLGAELRVFDDLGDPWTLRCPADPGEHELVEEARLVQHRACGFFIVVGADGVYDAAPVERTDQLGPRGVEGDLAFAEGAGPEGVVEVPDDQLDRTGDPVSGRVLRGRPRAVGSEPLLGRQPCPIMTLAFRCRVGRRVAKNRGRRSFVDRERRALVPAVLPWSASDGRGPRASLNGIAGVLGELSDSSPQACP